MGTQKLMVLVDLSNKNCNQQQKNCCRSGSSHFADFFFVHTTNNDKKLRPLKKMQAARAFRDQFLLQILLELITTAQCSLLITYSRSST